MIIPDQAYLVDFLERIVAFDDVKSSERFRRLKPVHYRTRQLTGLALAIGALKASIDVEIDLILPPGGTEFTQDLFIFFMLTLGIETIATAGAEALQLLIRTEVPSKARGGIWNVTTNRRVEFATLSSVPAVKADAARQLFSINCSKLTWAVIDSGIDGDHQGFLDDKGKSRVISTYDFGMVGRILDKRNLNNSTFLDETVNRVWSRASGRPSVTDQTSLKSQIVMAAKHQKTDWSFIEPLVAVDTPNPPSDGHGTHVAGILAGKWIRKKRGKQRESTELLGICPDIRLIDVRVLGATLEESEFSVIAALQFLKYLNEKSRGKGVDGVNLSLSIPHDVQNYACGATPACVAAEALVANKVVVVAAAGNYGYQSFRLTDGDIYKGYAVASITDPGNAENVITVGSTHRNSPESFGVSYFSSRGPTGDGRAKPDILAPGERIRSAVPDNAIDTMDGTSMAAPHVSGAAALLMARHTELRGKPQRIKQILCETATDIGRTREFQGAGMLDILRAIQSK